MSRAKVLEGSEYYMYFTLLQLHGWAKGPSSSQRRFNQRFLRYFESKLVGFQSSQPQACRFSKLTTNTIYVYYSFLTKRSRHKLQEWKPIFILYCTPIFRMCCFRMITPILMSPERLCGKTGIGSCAGHSILLNVGVTIRKDELYPTIIIEPIILHQRALSIVRFYWFGSNIITLRLNFSVWKRMKKTVNKPLDPWLNSDKEAIQACPLADGFGC